MRRSTRWAWGLLALTLLLAGCKLKRVEDEKSVTVSGKGAKASDGQRAAPEHGRDGDGDDFAEHAGDALPRPRNRRPGRGDRSAIRPRASGLQGHRQIGHGRGAHLQGTIPAGKECTVDAANGSGTETEVKAKIVGKY